LQAPAPLQSPFSMHVVAPAAVQSPSGSVSTATGAQSPFVPPPFLAAEQAWQSPVQGPAQQTPSTQ
jgi:hypothetical protein